MRGSFSFFTLLPVVLVGAKASTVIASTYLATPNMVLQDVNTLNSSSVLDTRNFALSSINPMTGTMGVSASVDSSAFPGETIRSLADATHIDDWTCTGACGPSVPFALSITLDGTASPGDDSTIVNASYGVTNGGNFKFSYQDGDGLSAYARFFDSSGSFTDVPVTLTTDANGNNHFSVTFSLNTAMSCMPQCGSDNEFLQADVIGGVDFVDASHTMRVTITSLDPNSQLTSADGRTAGPAVPEPNTLSLFAIASLAGIALRACHRGTAQHIP